MTLLIAMASCSLTFSHICVTGILYVETLKQLRNEANFFGLDVLEKMLTASLQRTVVSLSFSMTAVVCDANQCWCGYAEDIPSAVGPPEGYPESFPKVAVWPKLECTSSLRIESTYGPTVGAEVSDEVNRIAAKLVNTKIATGDDRPRTNHLQMSRMESAIFCEFLQEPLLGSL